MPSSKRCYWRSTQTGRNLKATKQRIAASLAAAGSIVMRWWQRSSIDVGGVIDDALDLDSHSEAFRVEFNPIRPHEAIAWNRPHDFHTGRTNPTIPTLLAAETLPIA